MPIASWAPSFCGLLSIVPDLISRRTYIFSRMSWKLSFPVLKLIYTLAYFSKRIRAD